MNHTQPLHVSKNPRDAAVKYQNNGFQIVLGIEGKATGRVVVGGGDPSPGSDLVLDDPPEDWTPPDQDRAEGLREAASEWVSSHVPNRTCRVLVSAA